jgi:SpoVK/Ycf46/Vps4 family AAA+-type ATPase
MELPTALKNDVVVLDDELPTVEQLREIVKELDQAACDGSEGRKPLSKDTVERAVEAVQGLSAFAAEQTIAMALRKDGIDLDHAWAAKKAQVEQTKGLTIYRGGDTFADLEGLESVKSKTARIVTNKVRPVKVIVWLDELEKSAVGSGRGDTSGVSQDQEGTLLSFMEDEEVYGMMLVGVPGAGKSALCKAVGSEFNKVVIRIDMGAMQGSLVGQSQQQLRNALKMVRAVGGKNTLWLATSNSIKGLSPAIRSRFTNIYFFDMPTKVEKLAIWKVWLKKFNLADKPYQDDEGWVGRNIRQCCESAYMEGCSVAEAAKDIVPVSMQERDDVKTLRAQADGRYLSANYPGVYKQPTPSDQVKAGRHVRTDLV